MRILVFNWKDIQNPSAGGAEVFIHEVASRWASQGHEITFFTSSFDGASPECRIDGVDVVRRGGRFSVYWHARWWWRRIGRKAHFDVVVDCVNTRPFLTPRFVRDAPIVALFHQLAADVWHYEFPWPVAYIGRYLLEPMWLRNYTHVPSVTVSKSSRDDLIGMGLRNVTVLTQGFTPPRSLPEVEEVQRPTIIFVGRLVANKRPDHALQAFAAVRDRIPEAEMWVVGTGPLEAKLREQAPEGVTFHGRVSEKTKFELMACAHVLAVTSVREGWGLIVTEAAEVGTLPVGYDVAGLRDSIEAADGELVPAGDIPALAEELESQLRRGHRHPRRWPHSWDDTARELMAVLEST